MRSGQEGRPAARTDRCRTGVATAREQPERAERRMRVASHQTGMFMIELKDSRALLRTATVSSVARDACVEAMR